MHYENRISTKRRLTLFILISAIILACIFGILFRANSNKAAFNKEKDMKVFILLGQSNMGGYAKRSEFPEELTKADEDVVMMTDGIWVPLEPRDEFNGPEISFAREMKRLIRTAESGL